MAPPDANVSLPLGRDDRDPAVAHRAPRSVRPHGGRTLVDAEEDHVVGRPALQRRRHPLATERGEVRQHGDVRHQRERVPVATIAVPRNGTAGQRPPSQRHRTGRRSRQGRAASPRLDDGSPDRRTGQHVGNDARVPANQIEERPVRSRARRPQRRAPASSSSPAARPRPGRSVRTICCACATASSGRCRAAAVATTYAGPSPATSASSASCGSLPGCSSSPPTNARGPAMAAAYGGPRSGVRPMLGGCLPCTRWPRTCRSSRRSWSGRSTDGSTRRARQRQRQGCSRRAARSWRGSTRTRSTTTARDGPCSTSSTARWPVWNGRS